MFDRMVLPLPAGWSVGQLGDGTSKVSVPGSRAIVFVSQASSTQNSLTTTLQETAATMEKGGSGGSGSPVKAFRTRNGLNGMMQGRQYTNAQGQQVYSLVAVLQIESFQQVIYAALDNPEEFSQLAEILGSAIEAAGPANSTARTPIEPPISAPAIRTQNSSNGSAVLHTLPPTSRLSSVPFSIDWAQTLDVSPNDSLEYSRGVDGAVQWVSCQRFSKVIKNYESTVWLYPKGGHKAVPTKLTLASAQALLRTKVQAQEYDWELSNFQSMIADAKANTILGVDAYRYKFPGFVAWPMADQNVELMVSPYFVGKTVADLGLDYFDYDLKMMLSPEGRAWLLVYNKRDATTNLDRSLRLFQIVRKGPGNWHAPRVTPRFDTKGGRFALPTQKDLAQSCPDWQGGLIFRTSQAIWRMDGQGSAVPIAAIGPLTSEPEAARVSDPVVLKNGDIWFAISRNYSYTSHTDAYGDNHLSALLGDRSRLVRIRLGGGQVQIAEISSESLLGALGKSGVMKTGLLRPDYSTGGLLAYDWHHNIMYAVRLND
jgi:hypothetical protein